MIAATDYTPHVRHIGEEKLDQKGRKRHPARRWLVERTHGWLSKCRGILVRYSKMSCNYLCYHPTGMRTLVVSSATPFGLFEIVS